MYFDVELGHLRVLSNQVIEIFDPNDGCIRSLARSLSNDRTILISELQVDAGPISRFSNRVHCMVKGQDFIPDPERWSSWRSKPDT